MTTAEKCKVFVEDIKAYWDYTLITNYGWVLLIKDDYLRASIGEAILKGVDDKIITRLTKLYVLIEGHDDLINLFTENQNFALEVIEHLLQKGFSFTVGSMLTDSRRVKDLYYVYSMAKYLDLELRNELMMGLRMLQHDRSYVKLLYSAKCGKAMWLLPFHINTSIMEDPELVMVITKSGEFYHVKTIYGYTDYVKDKITALSLYSKVW